MFNCIILSGIKTRKWCEEGTVFAKKSSVELADFKQLMASSHRSTRLSSTVELSRVVTGGVNWAQSKTDVARPRAAASNGKHSLAGQSHNKRWSSARIYDRQRNVSTTKKTHSAVANLVQCLHAEPANRQNSAERDWWQDTGPQAQPRCTVQSVHQLAVFHISLLSITIRVVRRHGSHEKMQLMLHTGTRKTTGARRIGTLFRSHQEAHR